MKTFIASAVVAIGATLALPAAADQGTVCRTHDGLHCFAFSLCDNSTVPPTVIGNYAFSYTAPPYWLDLYHLSEAQWLAAQRGFIDGVRSADAKGKVVGVSAGGQVVQQCENNTDLQTENVNSPPQSGQ